MDSKALLLLVFGVLLVAYAIVNTPVSQHYVSALDDWNYMYEFTISRSVSAGTWVRISLPSDPAFWEHVNPDCSDVRITEGYGSDERLLPFANIVCERGEDGNHGTVMFFVDHRVSPSTRFRLYFGNPSAADDSIALPNHTVYFRSPPFRASNYDYDENKPESWGGVSFTRTRVYLLRWAKGGVYVSPREELRPYTYAKVRLYLSKWSHGTVAIPLSRPFPALGRTFSSSFAGVQSYVSFTVKGDGHIYYRVVSRGRVVGQGSFTRVMFYITVFRSSPTDIVVTLPSGSYTVSGDVNRLYVYAFGDSGGLYALIDRVTMGYSRMTVSASYSSLRLSPRAPKISIFSPTKAYLNDGNVSVAVVVTDPNDDLNVFSVSLDGNVLYTGNEPFHGTVSLSDGEHVLSVSAKDDEGIVSERDFHFIVDTVPPELNVSDVSIEDGNVSFSVSASDDHLDRCFYAVNGENAVEILCDGNYTVKVGEGNFLIVGAVDRAGNTRSAVVNVPVVEKGGGNGTLPAVVVVREQCDTCGNDLNAIASEVAGRVQQASPLSAGVPSRIVLFVVVFAALSFFLRLWIA